MASFLNLAARQGIDFDEFWGAASQHELYHFIGKDIPYFHALFWPAMLSGARLPQAERPVRARPSDRRRPEDLEAPRQLHHGRRLRASKLDPDYLRYYYASKLGPTIDDLDLNLADFVAKVNSDLVGKLVNIASRCAGFVHKLGGGRLADRLPEPELYAEFAAAADDLANDFESASSRAPCARSWRSPIARISTSTKSKPWILAKDAGADAEVVAVCTLGLNLFRALIVYLKPIVPALAARAEALLAAGELELGRTSRTPLLGTQIAKFEALLTRVEQATVEALTKPAATNSEAAAVTTKQWQRRAARRRDRSRRVSEDGAARRARHRGVVRRGRRQAAEAQARRRRRGTHGVLGHPQLVRACRADESPRRARRELGAAQDALRRLARHGARRKRRRPRHLPAEPRFGRQARHEGELAMGELLLIALGAALVNNFVLVQFLGVCPFIGGSQRVEGAIGMGLADRARADARGRPDAARRPLPVAALRARVLAPVRRCSLVIGAWPSQRHRARSGASRRCCRRVLGLYVPLVATTVPCSASRSSIRRRAAASSPRCSMAPARRSASGSP